MASNQDFIFTLGADISQFTKSITEVERELKDVRNSLKNQTGQAIVETNKYIQQLEGSLTNLRKTGLGPSRYCICFWCRNFCGYCTCSKVWQLISRF